MQPTDTTIMSTGADGTGAGMEMPGVLPPNNPARPCWQFFKELFGSEESPPEDNAAARKRLRQLLQKAYAEKPYKLIRMALFSSGRGGMQRRIEALVSKFRAEGVDVDTRQYVSTDTDGLRSLLADPAWRSTMNYLLSQWWSMDRGEPVEARVDAYRKLSLEEGILINTNQPIRAWLPEKCGVVPYLRARTSHILMAYYEAQAKKERMVSLDHCEQFKLELTTERRFVRTIPSQDADEDAGEALEEREERIEAETMEEDGANRVLDDIHESTPVAREAAVQTLDDIRRNKDELILTLQGEPGHRPGSYPDWPLRAFAQSYGRGDGEPIDMSQARAAAKEILLRLKEIDSEINSDLDTLIEAVDEWDGSVPLVEFVPELSDKAYAHRYSLLGLEPPDTNGAIKSGPEAALPAGASEVAQAALTILVQSDLNIGDSGALPDPVECKKISIDIATFAEMNESEDVDVDDPARADYGYLAQKTGQELDWDLRGPALHHEMARLRDLYCRDVLSFARTSSPAAGTIAREMAASLKNWDPGSEMLNVTIHRILQTITGQRCPDEAETSAPERPDSADQTELNLE